MSDLQKIWHYNQPGTKVSYELRMFLTMVARGRIQGASLFGSYGKYTATGAVTKHGIWPGPTSFPPWDLAGVSDGYLVSTSANDTLGGSGIQQVEVYYIDISGDLQHEILTMTGTTPVPLPFSFRFIQCTHTVKGQFAGGNISLLGNTGTVTYSYILVGDSRCTSAFRMVPRGKTAYIVDLVGGATSGTAAASADLEFISTEIDTNQLISEGIFIPHNSVVVQDTSLTLASNTPAVVTEGQICGFWGTTDKGVKFSAAFTGWLEDSSDALEIN
jgi:hypothetical protein